MDHRGQASQRLPPQQRQHRPRLILPAPAFRVLLGVFLAACCLPHSAHAQPTPDLVLAYNAYSVAVDPRTQELYVSDTENDRVLKFGAVGTLSATSTPDVAFGQPGPGTSLGPNLGGGALATRQDSLYGPRGIFADASGTLWVADYGNNRVVSYGGASGRPSQSLASQALGQVSFTANQCIYPPFNTMCGPSGVLVDDVGTLWVADTINNRVLAYLNVNSKGALGGNADSVLGQADLSGSAQGVPATPFNLHAPLGVAVTDENDVMVADTSNNRVLFYVEQQAQLDGGSAVSAFMQTNLISSLAPTPPGPSSGSAPSAVTLDTDGNVYIADTGNNRVLSYLNASSPGPAMPASAVYGQIDFVSKTPGSAADNLNTPTGVFFDSFSNALWIADHGNSRVLRFSGIVPTISATDLPSLELLLEFQGSSPNVHMLPKDKAGNTFPGVSEFFLAFDRVAELDSANNTVALLALPTSGYGVALSTDPDSTQHFDFTFVRGPLRILIAYQLFLSTHNLTQSGTSFSTSGSTCKLSIDVSGWNFSSPSNSLAFFFDFTGAPPITSIANQGIDADGLAVFDLVSPKLTTTVRFLQAATADSVTVPVAISFQGLKRLILRFPSFATHLSYDPDFSVTLTGSNSNGGDGGSDSNLALLALLALLVIPCALVAAVAIVVTVICLVRWTRSKRFSAGTRGSVHFDAEDM